MASQYSEQRLKYSKNSRHFVARLDTMIQRRGEQEQKEISYSFPHTFLYRMYVFFATKTPSQTNVAPMALNVGRGQDGMEISGRGYATSTFSAKMPSEMDVAPWCYEWVDGIGMGWAGLDLRRGGANKTS